MRRNRSLNRLLIPLYTVGLIIGILSACKKDPIVYNTSTQVNITGFLDKNPDQFSEFRKVLELTETDGFLQAYGNYTMFLPTNDAVKAFLQETSKTSVEQVDKQELKNLVRFHLLEDTIASSQFGDGKLNALTMFGQYLITGATNTGGVTKITVNRQANLGKANIRVGNGYIHIIDKVLRPAKFTLAQMIEANPDYSIFTQALKETGLYDTLNVAASGQEKSKQRFFTVLAESNQILTAAGYSTFEALKSKFSKSADLKNPANGLNAFVAYHILRDAKYLGDIASSPGHPTLTKPEIISAELKNEQVLLNDMEFNGIYEPGFILSRSNSDNSASNGVLHTTAPFSYNYTYKNAIGMNVTATGTTNGHFTLKTRIPFPVYWDIADFPEMRRNPSFRKPGTPNVAFSKSSATAPSPIKNWWWPKTGLGVEYRNDPANAWVYGDYLNMFLGNLAGNVRQEFIQTQTPLVVRGKYNVWVCYRRQNQSGNWPARIGTQARIKVDGEVLPKPFYFAEPIPFGSSAELESLGWKYYTSSGDAANPFLKQTVSSGGAWNSPWIAKNVGVVEIKSTDVHTLVIEALADSQNANNLDMIHLIPIDWPSQILPRFMKDGSKDNTNYPGTH